MVTNIDTDVELGPGQDGPDDIVTHEVTLVRMVNGIPEAIVVSVDDSASSPTFSVEALGNLPGVWGAFNDDGMARADMKAGATNFLEADGFDASELSPVDAITFLEDAIVDGESVGADLLAEAGLSSMDINNLDAESKAAHEAALEARAQELAASQDAKIEDNDPSLGILQPGRGLV